MPFSESIGYLASALVALSFLMTSLVRLRWVNLAGALCFLAYGVLIEAWPVIVTNGFIAVVQVVQLRRLHGGRADIHLAAVRGAGDPWLLPFLDLYRKDIARFQPEFDRSACEGCGGWFVVRDTVPAGLLLLGPPQDGEGEVLLDYVPPAYRDLRAAQALYQSHRQQLLDNGYRTLVARASVPAHTGYLQAQGFQPAGDGVYRLQLA